VKTSTACPSCNQTITLARVLRAPTPFHLRCGCGARLRVRGPLIAIMLLLAVPLGVAIAEALRTYGLRALAPAIAVVLVAELGVSLLVLNSGKLERR
jgi:hypothetical protein